MRNTARIVKLSQDHWPCAAMQNILTPEIYRKVIEGIGTISWEQAQKDFYLQREADLSINRYYKDLFSPSLLSEIKRGMEHFFDVHLQDNVDIVAHKMIKGDYIGIHTDENPYGETHRLTVMLNREWSQEMGGVFMSLNGRSLTDLRDAWLPLANTGFAFEISSQSFHAVSPILTETPRYCLIFTFKKSNNTNCTPWVPFVLSSDVDNATSTASHMGISPATFSGSYEIEYFDSKAEFLRFINGALNNAPQNLSYRNSNSINVDQTGEQRKGTDEERISLIKALRRIPLPIIVRRKDNSYTLVDGSHRLSYAFDELGHFACAIFAEV